MKPKRKGLICVPHIKKYRKHITGSHPFVEPCPWTLPIQTVNTNSLYVLWALSQGNIDEYKKKVSDYNREQ